MAECSSAVVFFGECFVEKRAILPEILLEIPSVKGPPKTAGTICLKR